MKQPTQFFKLLFGLFLFSFTSTFGQDLPRRSFLGIQMDTVPAEMRKTHKSTENAGVLISGTVPESTAAKAGFQKGDVLFEFDGIPVTSSAQMVGLVKSYSPGQQLEYKLLRGNKIINKKLTISPLPKEEHQGIKTTYGSVKSVTGEHRTILMEPNKNGKHPAILFIQGVGCYSIDSPLDSLRTEIQLLTQLTREGYVTLRVEKSGMGDSKGKPCIQVNVEEELSGFAAAFDYLKSLENVDSDNIFIIGHSMGGLMAPLLAKEKVIKGIIAFGTIGVNFLEYYINSRRNIAEAYEMSPAEADDYVKREGMCMTNFMASVLGSDNAVELTGRCQELAQNISFRDADFWKQLFEINVPGLWTEYDGNVLAARGSYDYVSTKEEHEFIADLVSKTGGKGKFLDVPNTDHGMNYAESYQQALKQPGGFNQEVFKAFLEWLNNATSQTKS